MMSFTLPDLPYAQNALEPHISAATLETHHGKHHKAYVDNLNKLVAGTPLEGKSLEEVILAAKREDKKAIFNNAAQVWNHTFFWNCLSPNGGGQPTGAIADKINQDLGGYDKFREQLQQAAVGQFGSGWAWLVLDGGKLAVVNTPNAENPLTEGKTPLLTIDVWEHAYYIDYRNRRPDFVTTVIEHLINWDFVNQNLAKAA
ncbi:MAG TPA: superoxide dismutase [Sphingomonadales bacterium]